MLKPCDYCNTLYEYTKRSGNSKYCSHKCANNATAAQRTKERITRVCSTCKQEFTLLESVARSREKRLGKPIQYCSKKCEGLGRRKREVRTCLYCGKPFETTRNNLCSRACSDAYKKQEQKLKKEGYWLENGYKVLYTEDGKGVKEHIKVMEDFIGRKLKANEVVHHVNGDKLDNHLENLRLMTQGEHARLHRLLEREQGRLFFGRD